MAIKKKLETKPALQSQVSIPSTVKEKVSNPLTVPEVGAKRQPLDSLVSEANLTPEPPQIIYTEQFTNCSRELDKTLGELKATKAELEAMRSLKIKAEENVRELESKLAAALKAPIFTPPPTLERYLVKSRSI